ncbi:zinc ABC transporter substrate-binding protein [Sulfitobacter sp. D35]|uniref:metal ABC transporter solute-binding protein, Zn/Mn family n=1 Tax=Sulfitobacter sp. D35 TaxID=3083252 RepID=UPI00296FE828|nr:zinc ABC transporter substrate-binding protein [Sulfitobacter sp. D35]MDW4498397.1 zinc ABC transporter substrate-binding protein [Sulfitobacter sp. D35]
MTQRNSSFPLTRRAALAVLTSALAFGAAPRVALSSSPLDVVATTGMIADAAMRIGGTRANVRALMGPGVDPHSYRQTRSDIVAMTRADLVLWHGLYLEAQMEQFLADLGRKREVVAVADALPEDLLLSHADYAGRHDPHVWMVPTLWAQVLEGIPDLLAAQRPEAAEDFAANWAAHKTELAELDSYGSDVLSRVPEGQRVLLTAHDAFGYFGRAYGFEVIGIQGISTESEAGLNRIGELVDLLVERGIRAVFVESSVSDRNIRALVEGAGARGHEVGIGGELFSDAMGVPGTYEGTYLGMIDHNVTVIAGALGADVDPRGRLGKLATGS